MQVMSIIAPPDKSGDKLKPLKASKSFLTDALSADLRRLVPTENGQVTAAQAMADRLINIALYAESNTDAIAAQKLIYERVVGKATVVKEDDAKPMPKVIFSLSEDGLDKVNASRDKEILDAADVEDNSEDLIIAEMDGVHYVG